MAKPFSGVERRKHPRKRVTLEIHYVHLDDFFYDYAINLSRGGMFIRTTKPLPVGSQVKLRFEVPGSGKEIQTPGRVVRIVSEHSGAGEPGGMGVAFEGIAASDVRLINRLWDRAAAPRKKSKPKKAGKTKPARRGT